MAVADNELSTIAQSFLSNFQSIQSNFIAYGQTIFFSLLGISIVLKSLEYAASGDLGQTLPQWMRELLIAMFFYMLVINLTWLASLPNSAEFLGGKYLTQGMDPSSVIWQGMSISNKLIQLLVSAGFWDGGGTMYIGVVCIIVIMFCFIGVAVGAVVTMVVLQALIMISPLFLAAGAFKPSRQMAKNVINLIIANSAKLLGYYLIIYMGNSVIVGDSGTSGVPGSPETTGFISQIDPTFNVDTFSMNQFGIIVAVAILYYTLSRIIPSQFAKLVSSSLMSNSDLDASISLAISKMTEGSSSSSISTSSIGSFPSSRSSMASAMANYRQVIESGSISSSSIAAGRILADRSGFSGVAKSSNNTVSDYYKNINR